MREKMCTICKEPFTYKNKSKQYCSNACKQQALRNRQKVKLKQSAHSTEELNGKYNVELINRMFNTCIKQTEAMCKGISIHYSIIIFMKEMIQSLKLNAPVDSKLKKQLERMKGIMTTLYKYSKNNQCEYGYVCFDQLTSDKTLNAIKQIKRHLQSRV